VAEGAGWPVFGVEGHGFGFGNRDIHKAIENDGRASDAGGGRVGNCASGFLPVAASMASMESPAKMARGRGCGRSAWLREGSLFFQSKVPEAKSKPYVEGVVLWGR